MELTHAFTVPLPPDEAFDVLTDVARIAPCMPGATLEGVEGDTFSGRVKVKVGPMQVTYSGTARFVELDRGGRRAAIEARGSEVRGAGTAAATISARLEEDGGGTRVEVRTELNVTGRPAQFGRGVMADVGEKLLGRFADCLAEELGGRREETAAPPPVPAPAEAAPAAPEEPTPTPGAVPAGAGPVPRGPDPGAVPVAAHPPVTTPPPASRAADDAIDLLEVAGPSVAKRVVPVALVAAAAALVLWLLRRRGR